MQVKTLYVLNNNKVLSKYDQNHAQEALQWVSSLIEEDFDTNGDMENFQTQLKDGIKLCK